MMHQNKNNRNRISVDTFFFFFFSNRTKKSIRDNLKIRMAGALGLPPGTLPGSSTERSLSLIDFRLMGDDGGGLCGVSVGTDQRWVGVWRPMSVPVFNLFACCFTLYTIITTTSAYPNW